MTADAAGDLTSDQAFALTHIRVPERSAVAALWRLDVTLGRIVATTTQPMVGQMRLTWWHEALSSLTPETAPAQPELSALATHVLGCDGIAAIDLAAIVEGWEALLEPLPLGDAVLTDYAERRGGRLFALTARVLGVASDDDAGVGWALVDFGLRCSDRATASRALLLARDRFEGSTLSQLPRPLRILARLVEGDVRAGRRRPRTLWRLLRSSV